ncbi:hypothetical protein NL676_010974 [Syzygium grande]|nr:hypothetical protein NL676_010974 [Syzygium grande]
MERVVQVLVKAVVNRTKKVVSGSMSIFSMAEEVVKRLVVIGPEYWLAEARFEEEGPFDGNQTPCVYRLIFCNVSPGISSNDHQRFVQKI